MRIIERKVKMDKNKLLNSLKNRRTICNDSLKSSYVTFIKNQEGVKLLTDIIEEVEENHEDEMFGIDDILNGMKRYCELFQGKCENCFFFVKYPELSKSICVCDYVKRNTEDRGVTDK